MLLKDVLATAQLAQRPATERPHVATVLAPFEHAASCTRAQIWDAVSAHALALCNAESAGVSIFADSRYDELTWVSTAGELAPFRLRRFPQRHSLCGVVFERKATQLFIKPHRYFQWIAQAGVTIKEGLVVPMTLGDRLVGTIWVMTHRRDQRFTATDAAILEMLGDAATSYIATHCSGQLMAAAVPGAVPSALGQQP